MNLESPNFTQLPNIILDNMHEFTDAELRVALCICRQTFGWHRESKKMSISFMMKATGMSHQGVIKGCFRLVEKGILNKTPNGDSYEWSLVVNAVDTLSTPLIGVVNAVDAPPLNAVDTKKERGINKPRINKEPSAPVIPLLLQTPAFQEAWGRWNDHLRQKRKPATSHALDLQLKKLEGWGEKRAIAAINNSITGNWQGIYEEKLNGFQKPRLVPGDDDKF